MPELMPLPQTVQPVSTAPAAGTPMIPIDPSPIGPRQTAPTPSPAPVQRQDRAGNQMLDGTRNAIQQHKADSFDAWYRDQHPDALKPFAPTSPVHGSSSITNSQGVTTSNVATQAENDAVAESITRRNAMNYYNENVLTKDPVYANLQRQHAAAQIYRMTGQYPQMPGEADSRPAGPSRVTQTTVDPKTGAKTTTVTGSATPPKPGKTGGEQVAGVIKAGGEFIGKVATGLNNASRNAEVARHNREMEKQGQERIEKPAKPTGTDPAAAAAKLGVQQQTRAITQRLGFIKQRIGEINGIEAGGNKLTPEQVKERHALYEESQAAIDKIAGMGTPSTQPAPTNTAPPTSQPAPQTQPATSTTASLAGGRGPAHILQPLGDGTFQHADGSTWREGVVNGQRGYVRVK